MWCRSGLLGIILSASLAADVAATPSFDCTNAKTDSERAICESPVLSELDVNLAAVYREVLSEASTDEGDAIRADQVTWLIHRDLCGRNAECIEREIRSRLFALAFGYVGQGDEAAVAMGTMSGVYCARDGADRLVIEERDGAAQFSVESWQANGHSCGTPPLVGSAQDGAYIAQDGDCTLRIEPAGTSVVLTARPVAACKNRYCGARAVIDRMVFPLSDRSALGQSVSCD